MKSDSAVLALDILNYRTFDKVLTESLENSKAKEGGIRYFPSLSQYSSQGTL